MANYGKFGLKLAIKQNVFLFLLKQIQINELKTFLFFNGLSSDKEMQY